MTRNILTFASTLLLLAPSAAQANKPPTAVKTAPAAKKAAAAPAKKTTGPIVLGTNQLPGDFGELGTTYTIGVREPINVTLTKAEYTINRFAVGNNTWVPKADEKMLMLHFTLHNPNPRELNLSWASLKITAVDQVDTNRTGIQAIVRDGTADPLTVSLKPAQKIEVTTGVIVPAAGVVPKLIVERESGAPVIRYDLHQRVKALPSPIADEADSTGATARKQVPAQSGTYYPLGVFDARLDEVGSVDGKILNREAGPDKRYYTATYTIKNRSNFKQRYVWSDFVPELKDTDGEKAYWPQAILKAKRDEVTYGELEPGEEARIRFYFPLPKNVEGKTLQLGEGKQVHPTVARSFVFDLTTAPKAAP